MFDSDIELVLEALGVLFQTNGHEANALCPGHIKNVGKQDHSPSWWINLDTGMHICFSCGYKGNLLHLICDVQGFYLPSWNDSYDYDYKTAEEWLKTVAEVSMEVLAERLANIPTYIHELPKPVPMSEARLAIFVDPSQDELDKRNITLESAQVYGVLWDSVKKNWILPLREPHFNNLMGWQEKGTINRTFMNRPAGLQKSKTLFGIENQNELCTIVVESPLDCLRLYSVGVVGAVAICGSSVSEEQIRLLRYSQKVIVAFDNDAAGNKASKEILKLARKYNLNLFFFNYGSSSAKDPGEMTSEEIRWGIENSQSSLLGEPAYVQRNVETLPS